MAGLVSGLTFPSVIEQQRTPANSGFKALIVSDIQQKWKESYQR